MSQKIETKGIWKYWFNGTNTRAVFIYYAAMAVTKTPSGVGTAWAKAW
jgi:hypothetical protein